MADKVPSGFDSVAELADDKPKSTVDSSAEASPEAPKPKLQSGSQAVGKMDSAPQPNDSEVRDNHILLQLSHVESQFEVITEKNILNARYHTALALCGNLPTEPVDKYTKASLILEELYNKHESRIRTKAKKRPETQVNDRMESAKAQPAKKSARTVTYAKSAEKAAQGGFDSAPNPPGQ
jgi:hypothetical protein